MKKIFIVAIILMLSGCATKGNNHPDLWKGELYHNIQKFGDEKELEHEINLKEDEIYRITIHFF